MGQGHKPKGICGKLMQKYIQSGSDDPEYRAHRDSVIKRFELSLDTFLKYLKFFLEETKGVVQNSPKPIMRECYRNGIITEDEGNLALAMIDTRNLTSHIYREEIAEQIVHQIPAYYKFMQRVLIKTQPED